MAAEKPKKIKSERSKEADNTKLTEKTKRKSESGEKASKKLKQCDDDDASAESIHANDSTEIVNDVSDAAMETEMNAPEMNQEITPEHVAVKAVKLGLPGWLANPTRIPAALTDENFTVAVDNESLKLSKHAQERCQAHGIDRFFPVQRAVMSAMLSSSSSPLVKSWSDVYRLAGSMADHHPGDMLVSAPTGSGKTLAYVLPIVEALSFRSVPALRALVILPTRDLVLQVKSTFDHYVAGTSLRVMATVGGGRHSEQSKGSLAKERRQMLDQNGQCRIDVLITTPGRLVDHLTCNQPLSLRDLRWLVIDEADRLLNQSFNDWIETVHAAYASVSESGVTSLRDVPQLLNASQVDQVTSALPFDPILNVGKNGARSCFGPVTHLQKLLFSATLTRNPGKLAALNLVRPQFISAVGHIEPIAMEIDQPQTDEQVEDGDERYILPASLKQSFYVCDDPFEKPLYLLYLIQHHRLSSTLCFCKSIEHVSRLYQLLSIYFRYNSFKLNGRGYVVEQYASTLSASERNDIMRRFNAGEVDLLICTDALSRGVDLNTHSGDAVLSGAYAVINYDPPSYVKTYVHRAGRSARAGNEGFAYTLLAPQECRHWKLMMRKYNLLKDITKCRWREDDDINYDKLNERFQVTVQPLVTLNNQ